MNSNGSADGTAISTASGGHDRRGDQSPPDTADATPEQEDSEAAGVRSSRVESHGDRKPHSGHPESRVVSPATDDVSSPRCDDVLRAGRDESLVDALAAGMSQIEAAALHGVSARTVQRLMAEPWARAAVAAQRRERVSEVTGALLRATDVAIDALVEVAKSGPARARVEAARQLLTLHRQHHGDMVERELEDRIDALEASLRPDPQEVDQ